MYIHVNLFYDKIAIQTSNRIGGVMVSVW